MFLGKKIFVQHIHSNNTIFLDDRAKKKGDRKANEKLLKEQGMLPSEKFNYKSVDFSSFQGGSTQSSANQTQFQQPRVSKYRITFS